MDQFDALVIGGGPAGLSAAIAAHKKGADVLLIEREQRLGGILKQCIHDGFGLIRFGEKLTGPEYVERFIDELHKLGIPYLLQTFVTSIIKTEHGFEVAAVKKDGIHKYRTRTLILATGCRERTAKQVFIHGTRPSGVFTAGTAQHFVNLMGQMPAKKCVILGSGDIGLIMARRLTLEGAKVLGVYEVKPEPSGLTRNIVQCLADYQIPLYLSHTVTRIFGSQRLEGVEIAEVDARMRPIKGTQKRVDCDTLILSVGLIPENEIAESLGIPIEQKTGGPVCDNQFMTGVDGVYSCGNALHVNDLVDYVSESGELAGIAAASYRRGKHRTVHLNIDHTLAYMVPQKLHLEERVQDAVLYFRSRKVLKRGTLIIRVNGKTVLEKQYRNLKPPEMERLEIDFSQYHMEENDTVEVCIREEEDER